MKKRIKNILKIDVQDTQDKSTPAFPWQVNISHLLMTIGSEIPLPSPLS